MMDLPRLRIPAGDSYHLTLGRETKNSLGRTFPEYAWLEFSETSAVTNQQFLARPVLPEPANTQ
jgi:hypothetical protein